MRRHLALAVVLAISSSCGGSGPAPAADAGKAASAPPSKEAAERPPVQAKAPPAKPTMGPPRDVKPSGSKRDEKIAELTVSVPTEWEPGKPAGPMRMAQLVLPGPGGDAELVVYRFKGGAGGLDANLTRWKSQFVPPEGKSIDDVTTVTKGQAGALATTIVDISGRYVAAVSPGSPQTYDEPDWRMLSAMVEGTGDPFFFKAVGPSKTVELWKAAFAEMIASAKAG